MKLNLDSPTDEAQIQIIPLIDVIFCILTFFILAALQLTRQQGINLELPKAGTSSVLMREMLIVGIDSSGQTYIDDRGQKQLVDKSQLLQVVQAYHQQQPDGLLVLQAAQTAFYNDVIQALDIMRSVAPDRVALSTAPGEQPSQATQQPGQIPTTPAPNVIPTSPTNTLPTNPNLVPSTPVQPVIPQAPGTAPQTVPNSGNAPIAPQSPQ